MNPVSEILGVVGRLFSAFKRMFLPDKKDLLGSIVLSIPLYLLFGLGLIFLLPLIIAGVFIVYVVRRGWRILVLYWTLRVMRKKTRKEVDKLRKYLD